MSSKLRHLLMGLLVIGSSAIFAHEVKSQQDETTRTPVVPGWWKGNTHTHTWWSDGDSPPESVAGWYRERDYNFLVLSDHNRMQEGEFWYRVDTDAKREALKQYREKFGDDWVERRVRLHQEASDLTDQRLLCRGAHAHAHGAQWDQGCEGACVHEVSSRCEVRGH